VDDKKRVSFMLALFSMLATHPLITLIGISHQAGYDVQR
jgi:hypothetical protein